MQARAFLLLLAVTLGCTDVDPPTGQCRYDSDCDEGAVCAGNYCRTGCVTDRDCLAGQRCGESDRFGVSTCHAVVVSAQCARTSDCPDGLVCLDNVCRAQCQQDYDCQVINPYFRCVAGACALTCAAGRGDCDGDPRNGCEAELASDPRHCLACGTSCAAPAHADALCAASGCSYRCRAGFADCDGSAANGCEVELATDAAHCGACGTACTVANGQGQCAAGVCARARCNASFDDCDGVAANGCEARIDSATHCGRCGNACTANMLCSAGACASSCAAGTTLCGESCVDLTTSATDCGACGRACPGAPNASPVCAGSTCGVACNAGFVMGDGGCAPIAAPRLVSPPSLSALNGSGDNVFEVALGGGTDGAVIELCRDRACTMVVGRYSGSTARVTRTGALAAGTYFWRAYGRVGANTGLTPSAHTWELRVSARAGASDAAWGSVLDINGDGRVDLAVGEPRSTRVLVYLNGSAGLPAAPTTTIASPDVESAFGAKVVTSDFNGDGYADLAVQAPDAQTVFIYEGSATGLSTTPIQRAREVFGSYAVGVAAFGDLNHDGYGDLAVGFTCFKGCSPGVDVYLGSGAGLVATPITLTAPDRFSNFGYEIAAVGRISRDSAFESFAVLMRGKGSNAAVVFRGSAAGVGATPTQTIELAGDVNAMAALGDVNGDGLGDLGFVAQGFSAPSQLIAYPGGATGFAATPVIVSEGENIGVTIAGVGDLNGDGFADVVASNGFHSARVFFGAASGTPTLGPVITAPPPATGAPSYGNFGAGLGFVGDLNGDGIDDLLVGTPDDGESQCRGAVFLFPGQRTISDVFRSTVTITVPDDRCNGRFGDTFAARVAPFGRARHT